MWRDGKPDKPGWWWLLPDNEEVTQYGWRAGARLYEVHRRGDITPGKPELFIRDVDIHHSEVEAFVFKGKVAGPIAEPITAKRDERLDRERAKRGYDRDPARSPF